MKNEKLQSSEASTKQFAPYREEAPMLSAPEIEKLLAERDMLPNNHPPTPSFFRRGSKINLRRIIMTLSGITGLGIAAYFAFFSNPPQGTNGTNTTDQSHSIHSSQLATTHLSQPAVAVAAPEKASRQPVAKAATRGPWSAGNDQIYADLSPEELARLGIVVNGDTVTAFKLPPNDTLESMQLTGQSIGGKPIAMLPPGVHAPHFFPMLMTFASGHGAAYIVEEDSNGKRTKEWGMIGDNEVTKQFSSWLQQQGTPGYDALGFTRVIARKENDGTRHDTLWLSIGKNFPKPRFFPLTPPGIDGYSDTILRSLVELAKYYDGSASSMPAVQWPQSLVIHVDTITPQQMLAELDSSENSSTVQRLHSIMSRLNELVPVVVRPHGGSGAPDSSDFIFWYEPSDEFFAALPPAQASAFRKKLAEPPHCMNAPEAVTTEAEVTYCVSEKQQVNVQVFDLMGHIVKSETQHAEAGDNIAKINTETLPSGMYIILVQDNDGGERTRRIWVQNANPK
ncbi:MAG TPA: T9SS type A sorting domain-containing protein [Candidatus Kapabacteria bacterium]|nr:T9SS type A sorting domain-containing protein [Candidatus Kapabacteria bacterium]